MMTPSEPREEVLVRTGDFQNTVILDVYANCALR